MAETIVQNKSNQYLVFRLGNEEYGLAIENVMSIVDNDSAITRVPTTPEYILGVINLRGDIIPIIDLAKKLGFTSDGEFNRKKIIVVNTDVYNVGIMVDIVLDVIQISGDSMENSAPYADDANKEYFAAVAKYDNRLIIMLDVEKLLED